METHLEKDQIPISTSINKFTKTGFVYFLQVQGMAPTQGVNSKMLCPPKIMQIWPWIEPYNVIPVNTELNKQLDDNLCFKKLCNANAFFKNISLKGDGIECLLCGHEFHTAHMDL